MKEIIDWLRNIESLASNVYLEASHQFEKDQKFSSFLSRMSEEETWHYHLIGSAAQIFLESNEYPMATLQFDNDTKHRVESSFNELYKKITQKTITRKDVVDCIIHTEFSELNTILQYAVKTLGGSSNMFQHVSATIQSHKEKIIEFLEDLPEDLKVPDNIYTMPEVWGRKILIVEDESTIREIFSDILKRLGDVETASDGQEGLELLKNNFYNVIVSDINMPNMDGIEFFQKAIDVNPFINRQFLFVSGVIIPEIKTFLEANNLLYLEKPVDLKRLLKTVEEIVKRTL